MIFAYIPTCSICESYKINFEFAYRDFTKKKESLIQDFKLNYYPNDMNFIKVDCSKNQDFCQNLQIQEYPHFELQLKIKNNTYNFVCNKRVSSLTHWIAAMLQPTIVKSENEGDVKYAASVLKKKSFFVIKYCDQDISDLESEFTKFRGEILVSSIKDQKMCEENRIEIYAERKDRKYYKDNSTSISDFILKYKNRAIGPVSVDEYKQWIKERKVGLIVVDPFVNGDLIDQLREQITDDYDMTLGYVDVSYYKFKGLFDKLEISEDSNLPLFLVVDNIKSQHYLQHIDSVEDMINIIQKLQNNPQLYQQLQTSGDEEIKQEQKEFLENPRKTQMIKYTAVASIVAVSLFLISLLKHKK